jgi:MFS family permease
MWQIFIFYSIIATLGDTSVSSFSATTVLSPWFPNTKGVMLGIADAGNPAGQAVITPLAQFTIINYGWRVGFQVLGSIFFLIVAPLNFLLQRRPPNYINNLSSQEETVSISKNPDITQCYAQSAQDSDSYMIEKGQFHPMKEPAVWYLVLSRATGSISHQMTNLHIIAFFVSSGYGQMQTATALGIAGLFGIIARPSFGILSDRIGREVVFTLGMGMSFLSILLVILFTDNASLLTLIIFVTLTGFSDGLSGLILGAKTADLYHPNVLGSVTGIVDIGRGIGIATGGIFTGLLFDKYGDYTLAYSIAATLLLISITAIWIVRLVEPKQLPA